MMAKRVLAVEDNPANMILIARIVGAEGHDLIQAEDGPKALSILDEIVPDLVLLDINIPGVHGLDVAKHIKADDRLAHIPVIATTANVLLGDMERCLEAGCDDYLPKPLDITRLREIMRAYLAGDRA